MISATIFQKLNIYRIFVLLAVICFCAGLFSGTTEAQVRYKDKVFTSSTAVRDIQFGRSRRVAGDTTNLFLNLFQPTGDSLSLRPAIVWAHGGSLISGARAEMENFCDEFARRGYVTATIDYRIGLAPPRSFTQFREALLRAVQDAKAAIRFFRMKAADYRIDTNFIFIGGSSAGSFVALQCGYWDQNELPADIDQNTWGDLEGSSGNPGYSSSVRGIVNYCGAIIDTTNINPGEPPVACFQGANDNVVPVDIGTFNEPRIPMYGSRAIGRVCTRLGIYNQVAVIAGMGHGVGDITQFNQLISFCADFLYSIVVPTSVRDGAQAPASFALDQNYPNPFNGTSNFGVRIANSAQVTLKVYDMLGREVAVLMDGQLEPGVYTVRFDTHLLGRQSSELASGVYLYRLTAGSFTQTRTMVLLK